MSKSQSTALSDFLNAFRETQPAGTCPALAGSAGGFRSLQDVLENRSRNNSLALVDTQWEGNIAERPRIEE